MSSVQGYNVASENVSCISRSERGTYGFISACNIRVVAVGNGVARHAQVSGGDVIVLQVEPRIAPESRKPRVCYLGVERRIRACHVDVIAVVNRAGCGD